MLMRFVNPSDLIGCGGDINQSESCKAHKARNACKGVGKNSIDLIGCGGDINQSESCKEGA